MNVSKIPFFLSVFTISDILVEDDDGKESERKKKRFIDGNQIHPTSKECGFSLVPIPSMMIRKVKYFGMSIKEGYIRYADQ